MSEIKITMRLFGSFRKYGEKLDFVVPSGSTGEEIKRKLADLIELNDRSLIKDSALANDNEIIGADMVFNEDAALAILPPVCGG